MAPKKKQTKKATGAGKKGKADSTKTTQAKAAPTKKPTAKRVAKPPAKPVRKQPSRNAKKAPARAAPESDESDEEPDQIDEHEAAPPAKAPAEEENEGEAPPADTPPENGEVETDDNEPPQAGDEPAGGRDGTPGEEATDSDPPGRKPGPRAPKRRQDSEDDERVDNGQPSRPSGPGKRPKRTPSPAKTDATDASGSSEEEQDYWDELNPLAEAQTDIKCTFKGGDATLRVTVRVHTIPDHIRSRLGYRARLTLIRADQTDTKDEGEVIGYVQAWRIDKPTAPYPNATKNAWRHELLGTIDESSIITETAYCMQALYANDGGLNKLVATRRTELIDNSLMFIEMIYISQDFSRNGLLEHALRGFHEVLGALTEWFAFAGTIVLIPAPPEGAKGKAWGKMSIRKIEGILIKMYRKYGQYEEWAQNARVGDRFIIVMGRTVP